MKKLILSLLILTMLTGCVSEPVKQEEVTTTKEETVTTAETTVSEAEETIEVSDYDTEYSPVKNYSDLTFRSIKKSNIDNDVITYIEPQKEPIFNGVNIGDDISSLKDYNYYDEKNKSYVYYNDSTYIVFGEDTVDAISVIEKQSSDKIYDDILKDALNLKNGNISLDDFISQYPLYSSYTADKGDVSVIYPNGTEIRIFGDEVSVLVFNNPYTEWDVSENPDVIDTKENYDAKELYDFMEIINSSDWILSPDGKYSALSYDDCAYYNARIIIRDGKEIKAVNTGHFASDLSWEDNKLYFEVYTGESCFYNVETDMIYKFTDKQELERNQSEQNISEIIENKATEINGKIAEYEIIDEENKTALALICHDNNIHDYWYFNGDSKELILSSKLNMSGYLKYEENGAVSIIAYENIVGGACPANIVAIADEKPVVLSTYSVGSETMPELYYNPFGNIICMRGNGVSSGSVNKIPYYWDEKSNSFLPYALHKIGIDELKSMDTDSIVENTEEITSVYKRDNGLIHVNYADVINADINSSITASKTYIQTENGLRNYDFEKDQGYGFFLEKLSVNE